MTSRLRFRKTLRDQITSAARGDRHYAALAGVEPRGQGAVEALKPKRIRKPSDPNRIMERHVLAAALKYLRHHPRVAHVERTQSGVFGDGERVVRVGFVGKLDISGVLRGGRAFELEAKRPGEKPTEAQAERIAFLNSVGAFSGWFDSIESLEALMRTERSY